MWNRSSHPEVSCKIHRKTPVPESLFKESCSLRRDSGTQLLACEYCDIFKNTFFTEHLRWLPLVKLESSLWNQQNISTSFFWLDYTWYHGLPLHCTLEQNVVRDIHRKIFVLVSIHIAIQILKYFKIKTGGALKLFSEWFEVLRTRTIIRRN